MNLAILGITADTVDDLPDVEPDTVLGCTEDTVATDNLTRATYAAAAVKAFANETGLNDHEPETAIADLLADLRHLSDALGLDADYLFDRATRYADDESAGRF